MGRAGASITAVAAHRHRPARGSDARLAADSHRAARPAVAAFATAGAVGRAALPHGPPGLRREPRPGRLLAGRAAGFRVAALTSLCEPNHHLILPVRMAPHPELKPLMYEVVPAPASRTHE